MKLPNPDDTLAVAMWLDKYPEEIRGDLHGLLMIGADELMIQGVIDQAESDSEEETRGD